RRPAATGNETHSFGEAWAASLGAQPPRTGSSSQARSSSRRLLQENPRFGFAFCPRFEERDFSDQRTGAQGLHVPGWPVDDQRFGFGVSRQRKVDSASIVREIASAARHLASV